MVASVVDDAGARAGSSSGFARPRYSAAWASTTLGSSSTTSISGLGVSTSARSVLPPPRPITSARCGALREQIGSDAEQRRSRARSRAGRIGSPPRAARWCAAAASPGARRRSRSTSGPRRRTSASPARRASSAPVAPRGSRRRSAGRRSPDRRARRRRRSATAATTVPRAGERRSARAPTRRVCASTASAAAEIEQHERHRATRPCRGSGCTRSSPRDSRRCCRRC